ncbi:cell adhesion molecule 4-like [Mugil cephalus]|uniref:cell adhesion molecule 4-like n=1 Tax=Mugil cephalus TaxID=48193 RepID=UPI001FB86008|nr:cell adhesion molecule 4-like [Mugil cephalus]
MVDSIPSSLDHAEEVLNKTVTIGTDDEDFAALIGGSVVAVLLVVICSVGVLLWCLARNKGSYNTNETDDYVIGDAEEDEESLGSDAVLQSKQPLKPKEEE